MKRLFLLLAMGSFAAGCFGACGSGESTSSTPASSTETTTTTPTTSGSDTTTDGTDTQTASEPRLVVSTDACTSDADCVPAGCCHPAACVARAHAPACGDSVCTTDCRYGTLDCGGSCLCYEGHCAAQLSALPHIPGVPEVQ